ALVVALGVGPTPARLEQASARRKRFAERTVESNRSIDRLERQRHQRIDADVRVERQDRIDVGDSGVRSREHRVFLGRLLEVVERPSQTGFAALLEEVASAKVQVVRLEVARPVICGRSYSSRDRKSVV